MSTAATDHYVLQSSAQLIPLFLEGNDNADNSVQSIHSWIGQSTNSNFDEQTIFTELPHSSDHNQNANEILKIDSPISTSILDDGTDIESSSYASYVVPLKIILPVEHVHKSQKSNSFERYNYILLKVDDVSYHEHIHSDTREILYPLNRLTSPPEELVSASDNDNNIEATTNTLNIFDADGNEYSTISTKSDKNGGVLVDSQGYRYELKNHFQIVDEQKNVEFDEIAVARSKVPQKLESNPIPKRISIDHSNSIATTVIDSNHQNSHISADQYERHYAKIFQWLHYHL